jgi:negative regulator of replication initiation
MYNGTDISLLLKEIQKVQDILMRVKEMKNGMLGSAMIQIQNEANNYFLFVCVYLYQLEAKNFFKFA